MLQYSSLTLSPGTGSDVLVSWTSMEAGDESEHGVVSDGGMHRARTKAHVTLIERWRDS